MKEIRDKIDSFYAKKDYENAHNYMIERLSQAIQENEPLTVLNLLCELMSYYRTHAKFEEGNIMASRTVKIIEMLGQENSLMSATAYLNIATLYRVEGLYENSLEYFEKCFKIYNEFLDETDGRFISLLNNISLLYQEIGEIDKAIEYSEKALCLILQKTNVESEVAITYTNLSQMYFEISEKEKAVELLDKALELFEENDPHYFAALATKAQNYFLEKQYDLSLDLYKEVLEKIEKTFGQNADYIRVLQNYEFVKKQKESQGFGLKLCKDYYFSVGKKMLEEKFPHLLPYLAVGLVGMGSECLGFDDEISRDHDFGPAFCIWLPKDKFEKHGKELQKEYDNLENEFKGFKRLESAQGVGRVGVFEINEFYENFLGKIPQNETDWLLQDEQNLLMMSSGEVFEDNLGEFSRIREIIKKYYPENIRIKKIINSIAKISQSGQYNFPRLLKRGDIVACNLALNEFVAETMSCIYLLNRRYKPYYKWTYHGLKTLSILNSKINLIEKLYESPNEEKAEIIEEICKAIASELKKQNLTDISNPFLQEHIPYLQKRIID